MKIVIAAIHGILTRETNASWPDRLDVWMYQRDPRVRVLKKEYRAGPFPRWNCWVKDRALARGLAAELALFLNARPAPDLWLVAHSNGAVIALMTTRLLIHQGHRIAGIILTGAACPADIERNHVLEWLRGGTLCCAIAYCSTEDRVVGGPGAGDGALRRFRRWIWAKLIWPYGSLGQSGWQYKGRPVQTGDPTLGKATMKLRVRWFHGGHSAYFAHDQIEAVFDQMYADVQRCSSAADVRELQAREAQ